MSEGHTERRRRALAIFDEVADLIGEARTHTLDALCDGDGELRAQVQALLDADAGTAQPFSGDAAAWGNALREQAHDDGFDPMLARSLGAWQVNAVLGRGGMGAVYRVERNDGAYAQQAALKLIRTSADSPAARERFLRERQILAQLQHPNIATLLDGGISGEGEPYFVMELVDGVPIDRWCDAHNASLDERVALFVQVLDAVQYAHRNLVVHRDLKPSNLLVDASGRVKLLDFGIAKQLEGAQLTATFDRALTFEYASPEQLHDAPITTATDIWQLGVVLHRLLSGAHPFGLTRDTPVASQLQQLEREPEPLTRAGAQASAEQAALRGHSPPSLAKALRGDLSNIVQACLQRDPESRYPSADALADDLQRWREHKPLRIAPPDRIVRAKLWMRRNRVAAAAAAAVVLALLAGTGVSLWQAREARIQTRLAEHESANARAALGFLTDALSAAMPEQAMSTEVSVRDLLDHARKQLDQRVKLDPQVRQPTQRMLGHLYASLGEPKIAVDLFAAGLKGTQPQQKSDALALAEDYDGYSDALGSLEQGKQSLAVAKQGAALRMQHAATDPKQQFLMHAQLAAGFAYASDRVNAEKQWKDALDAAKAMPNPPVNQVTEVYQAFGNMLFQHADYQRASSVATAGLGFADRHRVPAFSPLRANLLWAKAQAAYGLNDLASTEKLIHQAITIQLKAVGPNGTKMAEFYSLLGLVLQANFHFQEALAAHSHSVTLSRAIGGRPLDEALTLGNIGYLYAEYGDYPQALASFERAKTILDKTDLTPDHLERRRLEKNYARALAFAGRGAEARARLLPLRELARKLDGKDSFEYVDVTWQLVGAAQRMRDPERGMALLEDMRTGCAKLVPQTHWIFGQMFRYSAAFARMRGDLAFAEREQREALKTLKVGPLAGAARAELAAIRFDRGDRQEARTLLDQALPMLRESVLPQQNDRAAAEALAKKLGV